MDKLEDFIRNNREQFNQEKPSDSLWDKINDESFGKQLKMKPRRRFSSLRIAASIVILAFAVYGAMNLFSPQSQESMASQLPQEVLEMDSYYESQVTTYMHQVNQKISDPEILADIRKDLDALDLEKEQCFNELSSNLEKKASLEALVSTYRMKIQVLENIIQILNENENEDIHTL